jgi:hypothetical protein
MHRHNSLLMNNNTNAWCSCSQAVTISQTVKWRMASLHAILSSKLTIFTPSQAQPPHAVTSPSPITKWPFKGWPQVTCPPTRTCMCLDAQACLAHTAAAAQGAALVQVPQRVWCASVAQHQTPAGRAAGIVG